MPFYNDISDLTNDEVVFVRLTNREALPIRKSISKPFEFLFSLITPLIRPHHICSVCISISLGPTSQDRLIDKLTML